MTDPENALPLFSTIFDFTVDTTPHTLAHAHNRHSFTIPYKSQCPSFKTRKHVCFFISLGKSKTAVPVPALCIHFFLKRYKRKGERPISASLVVTRLLFQGRLPTLLCVHLVQRLFLLFYSSYYRPTFQPIVFWN